MALASFKGNIYQKHTVYVPELSYPTTKKYINLKGLPNKNFSIFAFENRSYIGEFEAEFKKALARESGAQGVLFDEKSRGPKIS
jgi:aspartate/tyrosine/aromatic aminotransferase